MGEYRAHHCQLCPNQCASPCGSSNYGAAVGPNAQVELAPTRQREWGRQMAVTARSSKGTTRGWGPTSNGGLGKTDQKLSLKPSARLNLTRGEGTRQPVTG